jgi:hypothetical protein
LIADAIDRYAEGDPDMLARRILKDIEAAEYEIARRRPIDAIQDRRKMSSAPSAT